MTPQQARALLALIADLYLLCQEPAPAPPPVPDQYQPPATRNEEMDMNRSVV